MVLKEAVIASERIPSLIPQAFPMIMVDNLWAFNEESVTSGLKIHADNIFCQNGKLSAPGIIEHMAQTIALYTGYQYFLRNEPAPTGYIGAIKSVEVISLPTVGDELVSTAVVLHEIMGVTLVKVIITCNVKEIAYSEMKTVIAR